MESQRIQSVYLKPAELFFSEHPAVVTTVLGSCVSVTMFHRRSGIGCICHALLPSCRHRGQCRRNCGECYKYVDCVIPKMVSKMAIHGIRPGDMEVKLFGGGSSLDRESEFDNLQSVGRQNVESALRALASGHLYLIKSDVGGNKGRKIFFDTHNGEIRLKRLGTLKKERPFRDQQPDSSGSARWSSKYERDDSRPYCR